MPGSFEVSGRLPEYREAVGLSPRAVGLWAFAAAWCARHDTDTLPAGEVPALGGSDADVDALVEAGWWVLEGHGYRFPGWYGDGEGSGLARLVEAGSVPRGA